MVVNKNFIVLYSKNGHLEFHSFETLKKAEDFRDSRIQSHLFWCVAITNSTNWNMLWHDEIIGFEKCKEHILNLSKQF